MSVNFRLISTALEKGKEITAPRCLRRQATQKNDQNSNSGIHSYRVIDCLPSGNTSAHNPCLHADPVNVSLYNSSAMNIGGAA